MELREKVLNLFSRPRSDELGVLWKSPGRRRLRTGHQSQLTIGEKDGELGGHMSMEFCVNQYYLIHDTPGERQANSKGTETDAVIVAQWHSYNHIGKPDRVAERAIVSMSNRRR